MSQQVHDFLAGLNIDSLDSLSALNAPGVGPDTTIIQGVLLARGDDRIAIGAGDRVMEIPLAGVRHLENDPSPPSLPLDQGVYVRAVVDAAVDIVVQRRGSAAELGKEVGLRPLVLARPSEASDYVTAYDERRDRERHRRLGLEFTERPSGPQALDSTKMTIGGTRFRTVFTTVTEHGDKMDVEMDDETDELGQDKYD